MSKVLNELDNASKRDDIPDFRAGDTVKVHVKVIEGNRSRVQVFQGVVIRRQGGGLQETFTVRKVSFGVGVDRKSTRLNSSHPSISYAVFCLKKKKKNKQTHKTFTDTLMNTR